jgi:rhodanese-related sulfurtransferase
VAEFLEQRGYRADALQGGFDAWKDAGFETGPLQQARQAA